MSEKKRIIVYGLGQNFRIFYKDLMNQCNVIALIDSDPTKIGSNIWGFIVKGKEDIVKLDYDAVVVTPTDDADIRKVLKEIGIDKSKICGLNDVLFPKYKDGKIKILFELSGGLGDCLINLIYINKFKEIFGNKNCLIYIFSEIKGIQKIAKQLNVGIYFGDRETSFDCDLVILVSRYPRILYSNYNKISQLMPDLIDYLLLCKKYEIFYPEYILLSPFNDGESANMEIKNGRTRIQQADIYGFFGIEKGECLHLKVNTGILSRWGLDNKKYITIHRGCDKKFYCSTSVKLWDVASYNELIVLIKKYYPEIPIVMIGMDYESNDEIIGMDYNLVGKTSFEELMPLIKCSVLHIDTEGGLVHLRHALGSRSAIVLFGPTNPAFFGYPENINLRTDVCPEPCEWKNNDWACHCRNSSKPNICMKSIMPEMVMKHVETLLK